MRLIPVVPDGMPRICVRGTDLCGQSVFTSPYQQMTDSYSNVAMFRHLRVCRSVSGRVSDAPLPPRHLRTRRCVQSSAILRTSGLIPTTSCRSDGSRTRATPPPTDLNVSSAPCSCLSASVCHPPSFLIACLGADAGVAGPTGCVGKNLALMELRVVTAAIVRHFTAELAPGWDHAQWLRDMTDRYGLVKGNMPVVLHARGDMKL
jgi:Cytochrome P450